jgi:methylated-DNA-protein-cysteine methyltransferase-like protein
MKRKDAPPESFKESTPMERAIRECIRSIPRGKVATYGQVAEAAGYPLHHRQVAQILRKHGHALPWHRVLGSGGYLKTGREGALEQRLRLEMEGVKFSGSRVRMADYQSPRHAGKPKSI